HRKSLKVLPTTGAAGKLEELRKQPKPSTSSRGSGAGIEGPGPGTNPRGAKKLNDETPIDRALDPSLTPEQRKIKEKIVEALQQVYDPELPVNLYDLGLIYRLDLRDLPGGAGQHVEIDMTLTAPNCPVAEQIPRQVHEAVAGVEGVEQVEV